MTTDKRCTLHTSETESLLELYEDPDHEFGEEQLTEYILKQRMLVWNWEWLFKQPQVTPELAKRLLIAYRLATRQPVKGTDSISDEDFEALKNAPNRTMAEEAVMWDEDVRRWNESRRSGRNDYEPLPWSLKSDMTELTQDEQEMLGLWRWYRDKLVAGDFPRRTYLEVRWGEYGNDGLTYGKHWPVDGAVLSTEILERGLELDGRKTVKVRTYTISEGSGIIEDPPWYKDSIQRLGWVHPKKVSTA